MADRFFIKTPPLEGKIELTDDQAHHVANVMRAGVGDAITVFDADGNEHETEIVEKSKKRVGLSVLSSTRPQRRLKRAIRIITALPKGDRQKFLVEKLVELGVEQLLPLETSRSVAQINDKVVTRIEKQIIEATKQCRRSYLMEISPAVSMEAALALAADASPQTGFYVAHPYAENRLESMADQFASQACCTWLIGPEGGFSQQEFDAAVAAGWTPVSFGEIILRVETAAMTVAVACGIA